MIFNMEIIVTFATCQGAGFEEPAAELFHDFPSGLNQFAAKTDKGPHVRVDRKE